MHEPRKSHVTYRYTVYNYILILPVRYYYEAFVIIWQSRAHVLGLLLLLICLSSTIILCLLGNTYFVFVFVLTWLSIEYLKLICSTLLTGNECHPELGAHVRAERSQVNKVDESPGLDAFSSGVRCFLHIAGQHRRSYQSDS